VLHPLPVQIGIRRRDLVIVAAFEFTEIQFAKSIHCLWQTLPSGCEYLSGLFASLPGTRVNRGKRLVGQSVGAGVRLANACFRQLPVERSIAAAGCGRFRFRMPHEP